MYNEHDADVESLYETNKFNYKYVRLDKKPPDRLVKAYKEKYDINTNCHHSCHTCQITQIHKYKDQLERDNEKLKKETGEGLKQWFPVVCKFIPKGLPKSFNADFEALKNSGIETKRAKRILLSSIDQAAWAELMFGFDDDSQLEPDIKEHWYMRWYQKHIIRCTANYKVLRAGRRVGKTAAACIMLLEKAFNTKVFGGLNSKGEKTYRGPEIMVVTPFQSQIATIFSELERFLKLNTDLMSEVIPRGNKLYTQTPPMKMEFTNGGSIIGYVTGANNKEDGSGGGSIRGETAEIIYMDEMDMIPEYILQSAINPIMISKPDTQLIASSTPIGKKASFYKWCNETPRFKEIYVPSTVLPQWSMFEPQILDESSEEAFKAEYMADFITESYGVFKSQYIAAARWNYNYLQTHDAAWWSSTWRENFYSFRICIGIDWNKNDGTEFCVAAYSPITGKFWVLEATNISPSQFSGQAYRDEVKRLNYKWNPHYIYADEGYGHTMIEDLQLEALHLSAKEIKSDWEKSIAGIVDKLTPINFSSKLELYNAATGTYVDKGAKEFLVENAVGIFEREMIRFAEDDHVLLKQLGNYIVVKRGENGKMVYGLQNESIKDHRLDAFIVALGGLAIKESMYAYALNAASRTFIVGEDGPPDTTPIEEQLGDMMRLIKRNNKSKTWAMSTQKVQDRGMDEADYNILKFREQEKIRSRSFAEQASTGKGYFSKKGAAEYSETHMDNGEIDMPAPMKIVPRFDRVAGKRGWR